MRGGPGDSVGASPTSHRSSGSPILAMLRPENHKSRPSSSESMDPPDPASRAPWHKKAQLVAGAGVAAPYLRTTCPGRPCVDIRQGVVGSVGWVMVEAEIGRAHV